MIFVCYKNLDRSYFSFVTIYALDSRTDRQTPFSSLVRAGIPCGAEKINYTVLQKRSPFSFL